MTRDEKAFLAAIAAAPDDEAPRKIYADWLDEHGRDDEAAYQRRWTVQVGRAEKWLESLAARIDLSYKELIYVGHSAKEHGGYSFGDTDASYELNSHQEEFWEKWELATGVEVTEETRKTYFSCAC